jgi:hypothetical protein
MYDKNTKTPKENNLYILKTVKEKSSEIPIIMHSWL